MRVTLSGVYWLVLYVVLLVWSLMLVVCGCFTRTVLWLDPVGISLGKVLAVSDGKRRHGLTHSSHIPWAYIQNFISHSLCVHRVLLNNLPGSSDAFHKCQSSPRILCVSEKFSSSNESPNASKNEFWAPYTGFGMLTMGGLSLSCLDPAPSCISALK